MEACVARLVIASSTEDCCIKESKMEVDDISQNQ